MASEASEASEQESVQDSEPQWGIGGLLHVRAERGQLRLIITLGADLLSGRWMVIALQSNRDADGVELLDNHAHQHLGEHPFAEAVRIAHDYVTAWQRGEAPPAPPCACKPIESGAEPCG